MKKPITMKRALELRRYREIKNPRPAPSIEDPIHDKLSKSIGNMSNMIKESSAVTAAAVLKLDAMKNQPITVEVAPQPQNERIYDQWDELEISVQRDQRGIISKMIIKRIR